ncbi:MAG: hypothetical protein A2664_03020 [Candidatus Taylorbacteria bacterium RIFCSPHIGHO2_01_FULL_46_22b]|uniref:Uncharacterized protein n=1 Tax=Candidatus Taylorbacteria bacterium RIFCSPHIGHO2_01_FULL_46_22b TaxID=1802301 RepID=A0A1G2M3W5_9BACT|nr:MAG: hypothetical protein A2664_03020 [Candidatus Taylorbacteria bacterium RIFCSPHIGHO2_01_FULL_46_22b]
MKKELKTSRAEEVYLDAIERKSFKTDLDAFMKRFRVPNPKLHTEEKIEEWLLGMFQVALEYRFPSPFLKPRKDNKYPKASEYIPARIAFLKKYRFSVDMNGNAMDEIIGGKVPAYTNVDLETPIEHEERINGRRSLKIVVYAGATREEVLNYIKRWWKYLRKHLEGSQKVKRVRVKTKRKEDALADFYSRKPVRELMVILGEKVKPEYKATLVERILNEIHGYPSRDYLSLNRAVYRKRARTLSDK